MKDWKQDTKEMYYKGKMIRWTTLGLVKIKKRWKVQNIDNYEFQLEFLCTGGRSVNWCKIFGKLIICAKAEYILTISFNLKYMTERNA